MWAKVAYVRRPMPHRLRPTPRRRFHSGRPLREKAAHPPPSYQISKSTVILADPHQPGRTRRAPGLLSSFLSRLVMQQLLYALFVLALFTFFLVMPKRRAMPPPPPPPGSGDDGGGEPHDPGLPDLDLPPGISRPTSDWEPDYNRPRRPVEA